MPDPFNADAETRADRLESHLATPQSPPAFLTEALTATPEFFLPDARTVEVSPFVSADHARFGGYVLEQPIGSGGSGVVYRAKSIDTGQCVAIKIIRPDLIVNDSLAQRFEKEARMHGSIQSDYIPRQVEHGKVGSLHFIASEFIRGIDLQQLIQTKGCLHEELALRICSDLLKALCSLHRASMIHRDIKPGNIVLESSAAGEPFEFRRAKLTDFGLARYLVQTESLEITKQHFVGTPLFQAPEFFSSHAVVSRSGDIYSVGATLFCMLVGHPPFSGQDFMSLIENHRTTTPPSLHMLNEDISGATSSIVSRALEKEPRMRYQHAEEMLHDIENILKGDPVSVPNVITTSHIDKKVQKEKTYTYHWDLDASVESLWPLVSDTDRFNRAIGLPVPEFSFTDTDGQRKLMVTAKFNGLHLHYLEHPFEWIEGREFSVLREFENGPFRSVLSRVELVPLSQSKTRVYHQCQVVTRGLFGKWIGKLQFQFLTPRTLARAYRQIEVLTKTSQYPFLCDSSFKASGDSAVPRSRQQHLDSSLANINERLDDAGKKLEDHQIASIAKFVRTASDNAVSRIRPRFFAEKLGCSDEQMLCFGFFAIENGLFNLRWDVICPVCSISTRSFDSVKEIKKHQQCEACKRGFEIDFANSVELIFRIHPQFRNADTRSFCIGGPFHLPHVLSQLTLRRDQELKLNYRSQLDQKVFVGGPEHARNIQVLADDLAASSHADVELNSLVSSYAVQPAPSATLSIKNNTPRELLTRVERKPDRTKMVTAAEVFSRKEFQNALANENINEEQLVTISSGIVVGVRVFNIEKLANELGELKTLRQLSKFLDCFSNTAIESTGKGEFNIFVLETIEQALAACLQLGQRSATQPQFEYCLILDAGQFYVGYDEGKRHVLGPAFRAVHRHLSRSESEQNFISTRALKIASLEESLWKEFLKTYPIDEIDLS